MVSFIPIDDQNRYASAVSVWVIGSASLLRFSVSLTKSHISSKDLYDFGKMFMCSLSIQYILFIACRRRLAKLMGTASNLWMFTSFSPVALLKEKMKESWWRLMMSQW